MTKINPPSEFDSKFVNERRNNTKSDLIEITEDKLENILLKHLNKVRKVQGWITPLTLFITILVVLLSSEFKNFLSIDKSVWQAFFMLSLILTFIWLVIASINAIKFSRKASINFLIGLIKNSQE